MKEVWTTKEGETMKLAEKRSLGWLNIPIGCGCALAAWCLGITPTHATPQEETREEGSVPEVPTNSAPAPRTHTIDGTGTRPDSHTSTFAAPTPPSPTEAPLNPKSTDSHKLEP
jgi:hypothetical protein